MKKIQQYFNKVMAELNAYKTIVDAFIPQYQAEVKKRDAFLADMKGKYTEQYISEYREKWKPSINYADVIAPEREKHQASADFYISLMKKDLDSFFNSPVRAEFANKVTAIKLTGLQLSNTEFRLLQESANTYLKRRLLNQLAVNRTHSEVNGQESAQPCWEVMVPDIDRIYEAFKNMQTNVNTGFQWYCGENMELQDFVADGRDIIVVAPAIAHALVCFDPKRNDSYKRFTEMVEKAQSILPESKAKTELTEADKQFIEVLLPTSDYERYQNFTKSKAVDLAKASEEIASILLLDPRFSKTVENALAEAE